MGTQGTLALTRQGHVFRKIVVGCNGMEIAKLAAALQAKPVYDPKELLALTEKHVFKCRCVVIQAGATDFTVPDGEEFPEEGPDFERWRDTFHDPKFNPRWALGTAAYSLVLEI